jgi:hypothetical protein
MTVLATEPKTVPFVQSCTDLTLSRGEAAGLRICRDLEAHPAIATVMTSEGEIAFKIASVSIFRGVRGTRCWSFKGHLSSSAWEQIEVRWNYHTERGIIIHLSTCQA